MIARVEAPLISDWVIEGVQAGLERDRRALKQKRLLAKFGDKLKKPANLTTIHTFHPTSDQPTINFIHPNFKKWFRGVEQGTLSKTLSLRELEDGTIDTRIVLALGGEKSAENTLANFFSALSEKERIGDFRELIGYAKDNNGILRPIHGTWDDEGDGDGWIVFAEEFDQLTMWSDGNHVLSRLATQIT